MSALISTIRHDSTSSQAPTIEAVKAEIQQRMSDVAGFICHINQVPEALAATRRLNEQITQHGIAITHPNQAAQRFQWQQMALACEALLTALNFYIEQGGGSRGARVLCSPDGDQVPSTRAGVLTDYRFLAENPQQRQQQLVVHWSNGGFRVKCRACGHWRTLAPCSLKKLA
ncbi:hypothetical protein ABC733_09395 [Mangrovibacter sp. SLW1]